MRYYLGGGIGHGRRRGQEISTDTPHATQSHTRPPGELIDDDSADIELRNLHQRDLSRQDEIYDESAPDEEDEEGEGERSDDDDKSAADDGDDDDGGIEGVDDEGVDDARGVAEGGDEILDDDEIEEPDEDDGFADF